MRYFLLILLLLLTSCSSNYSEINYSNLDNPRIDYVEINNVNIPVEIAATQEEQMLGLMYREDLEGGMLFLYNEEKQRNFWMKNTMIPLDMIFIDSNSTITAIHNAIPCEEDPCKVYSGNAKYVLEINPGSIEANEGDKVMFIKKQ